MRISFSPPVSLFRRVGIIAYQHSSGYCQNAISSHTSKSTLKPRQDSGFPGSDIILEPFEYVIQEAFDVYVIVSFESILTASPNFLQVFKASSAALYPVERYTTRALSFIRHFCVARYAAIQDFPI